MKIIYTRKGEEIYVDDEYYEFFNQFTWYVKGRYASTGKLGTMHRYVLVVEHPLEVDHINGNGLDNRRSNLRAATRSQNQMNKKSSGIVPYIGVTIQTTRRKYKNSIYTSTGYLAKIKHDGHYISLGRFKTPEEAALVYNKYAIMFHGEFARLNIIE